MRTYIKAYMSLNFGQIPPLTTELAALERLKNRCHHVISVDIDPIFFKLAGNKDMRNIMNEFEFRPDRTTDYGVSCPWASKKYPHRLIMGKMVFPLFMPRHQEVAGYYVIPSEILSVRPSVRPSVCLSVCLSVCPSVRPSVSAHHHSCIGNSSYSFRPILLKLYRCFKDGLKICILFFQNPEIIFYHFFPIFNLDIFRALILQICIWSMYLVSATPPTVFGESFWNFTGVLRMVWRYAYCFFRILKLFFITFFAFLT